MTSVGTSRIRAPAHKPFLIVKNMCNVNATHAYAGETLVLDIVLARRNRLTFGYVSGRPRERERGLVLREGGAERRGRAGAQHAEQRVHRRRQDRAAQLDRVVLLAVRVHCVLADLPVYTRLCDMNSSYLFESNASSDKLAKPYCKRKAPLD